MSRLYSSSALTLAFAAALLSASSCSMKKKLDQMGEDTHSMAGTTQGMANTTDGMAKTTQDMAKTTEDMKKTTEEMKGITERMDTTTCKMYTSLRQGNTKVSRDTDMTAIRNAKSITEKLELAAKYMQGFEFQVWSNSCGDLTPREIVIDQAATELLTTLSSFAENREKVSATKQSSDYETLYALVGTLHRINLIQEKFLKGTEEKLMTPLDVLVQGLRLNQAKNRGELQGINFPIWATTVGKYEKDAEFALRLRGNFLMAYGYAVADSNNFGDAPKLVKKALRLGTTNLLGSKWTPNLESRDATEIRERITLSLKLAKETRDAMTSLGIDPMVDDAIFTIWKKADFTKIDLGKMEKNLADKGGRARASAIRELIAARDALFAK